MKRFVCFLVVSFFSAVVNAQVGGAWRTLAPMPSARQEISTAFLNTKIYVIGSFTSAGASTGTVEVYDPLVNAWSGIGSIPIQTNHNHAAVATGKLYTFGGTSNRTFLYNPQNNSWADVAPMNFPHGNTAAVGVINDKIYVAGGNGGAMTGRELEVYNTPVFRNGIWYLQQTTVGFRAVNWGFSTDQPVVGDYDGDARADVAVFRPSDGFGICSKAHAVFAPRNGDKTATFPRRPVIFLELLNAKTFSCSFVVRKMFL